MSNHRVAYAYAKSLMELAIERGQLEEVYQDFLHLVNLAKSNRDFELAMRNPTVSSDKKLKILKALFEKRGTTNTTLAFFEILCRKNREEALIDIAKEFQAQYQLHNSIQVAEVTTTFPLDDNLRAEFTKIVLEISGMKTVKLIEKINPDLIGGFILRVNDRQLDESLSSKLRELRAQFAVNLYESKI
ncbi:F-type H+-transporting ATPase subunit delta [Algoriphagus alkaliphilus]|uniref:ATP synthase subunit delta n=1 Tax=Algoriphagus alkaliphilus TaxID=279824 RepID=A0A1G5YQQ3_9BACT|nr:MULTISPECIES: ATP synthase F1 subunit delta [Algoriphagus]MBA4299509.1 ATP synthase F1 subunit delta [Cyclobacterium sp.]MDP2043430.1 ATP synthase F1 subunit delta [Algoriphagus sp.]MDP3470444.1 ATP synthase F1 subunit delta [Algoriphagus sp.]SDA84793.1 F-type H+-transporting ATPase subunit delta [Algoriphagus alkaliphilus]